MTRLVLVHAHPDDETLSCGITIAHHVAAGDEVHVVTCTLGEHGEIIPPELAHHAADREDTLAQVRRGELHEAMARLGARHRVLGADPGRGRPSRFRDSGMAGMPPVRPGEPPPNEDPRAFAGADPQQAATLLAHLLRGIAPDLLICYDAQGGYGHPDHIQARRVALAAVRQLPDGLRPDVFEIRYPISWAREDRRWLAGHVPAASGLQLLGEDDPYPAVVAPDEAITHVVERPDLVAVQQRALAAHRTQVRVFDGYFALSNDIASRLPGREAYTRIDPADGLPLWRGSRESACRPWRSGLVDTRHPTSRTRAY